MKKKINNKGFSMVEILAVVVILGIISTIGIVSVTKILDKSRQHYYDTQEQQIVLAAQAYAASNKHILPKTIYGVNKVKLQELYDKKYIKDKVKDQNKNNCDPDKTRVDIMKSSKTDYTYTGYLNCPACEDGGYCKTKSTGDAPTIGIDFPDVKDNNLFNGNAVIKIDMNAKGDHALIGSYSYKIYVDGTLKYDSTLKINNKVATKHIEEKIYKFLPGRVKVVVTVTNTEGKTTSKSKTKNFTDTKFPGCGKISYDGVHLMDTYNTGQTKTCGSNGYTWINIGSNPGTRQAWVVCNDSLGIGCAQHEFSRVLTSEGTDDVVTVKDKNGYSHDCIVLKCIDKTSPSLTIKVFKATEDGGKTGSAKCTYTVDAQSSEVNHIKDTETCSTWLNKANYPDGVYVEVTVSDSLSKLKKLVWKQNDKEQKAGSVGGLVKEVETKDDINATSYTTHQIIKKDGIRRQHVEVWDNAGNKITGEERLKIDRTPPTVPTVTGYKKTSETNISSESGLSGYTYGDWYNKWELNKASGSVDNPDISGFNKYQYTTTGETADATNADGTYRNINAQGISKISYRACDVAGNCSNHSAEKTVKLDRHNPECSIGKSNLHTTSGVTLTTTCKDEKPDGVGDVSGVKDCESQHTGIKSNRTYTVTDNAGNSNTCSVSVYSKQKRNCSYYCSSSACSCVDGYYTDCSFQIHSHCPDCSPGDVDVYWYTSSDSDCGYCAAPGTVVGGSYDPDAVYTCTVSSSTWVCTAWSRCYACGCESWGNWYDLNSNSCSSDGVDTDCRTRYY